MKKILIFVILFFNVSKVHSQDSFDWPIVIECSKADNFPLPEADDPNTQSTDEFLKHLQAEKIWGIKMMQQRQCKVILSAAHLGWVAGKNNDPDPSVAAPLK